jgi:hypothetical protein
LGQEDALLRESYDTPPTLVDEQTFATLVPGHHYLRRVKAVLDFERYRVLLAPCCSATEALAHNVLADRADPEAGDQVVSVVDPEARRGKHGHFFTGYKLAVATDADSEIITALDLLPANADEAADAGPLIAHEEAVQGNDVQALSLDSIGWRGDLLRQWQDPHGLGLAVFVPPVPPPAPTAAYTADAFVLDEERGTLRCRGGHSIRRRRRTAPDTGWTCTFSGVTGHYGPLRALCSAPRGRV